MTFLASLLPPDVSGGFAAVLIIASFFTAAFSAALGLGGGILLMGVMALGLPVSVMVPAHGFVQVGSNASRTIVQWKHVSWAIVGWFVIGAAVGTAAGVHVVTWIPEALSKILLALYLLRSVFGKKPKVEQISRARFLLGGFVSSVVTMVVGTTGPLVAALVAGQGLTKQPLIATQATCLVFQHLLKVIAFGLVGFAFAPWAPLLLTMIAMGFLGTVVGTLFLDDLPEHVFSLMFKIAMALIAVQLIWEGVAYYL